MLEESIRPTALMDGARTAMLTDAGRLLSRRSEFIWVDCPGCGDNRSKSLWNKYGFDYVECQLCETMYINPRPTADMLRDAYANSANYSYWNEKVFPASEDARRGISTYRVGQVRAACDRYLVDECGILEIGCGYGSFLEEMQIYGKFTNVFGIEATKSLALTCQKRGLKVVNATIEQTKSEPIFNVVASFEVIEHVFSPYDFAAKCLSLLVPGGLLILSCPNGKGFDFVTLGRECGNMDHEHLNYFNPYSLTRLLQRCGFEVLECSTPGKLDAQIVRTATINHDYDADPFLRQVLVEKWDSVGQNFQTFLADNNLSSHLWLIARKPA